MANRIIALFLCLLLLVGSATAESAISDADLSSAVDLMNENVAYEAADSAGTVVNGDVTAPTEQQRIVYSFTPVDVVIVLDTSGSMDTTNPATGKSLLGYATDAAKVFCNTLFSLNPASRVGVVQFDYDAGPLADMQGFSNQQLLLQALTNRSYGGGGSTNTGAGFAYGKQMLNEANQQDRRQILLMITDGLANSGVGDPVNYAISQGRNAAQGNTNVYTIGLVGGMGNNEKQYTRRVLSAGYESRYFEVDFNTVGDMGAALTNIMTTLPVAISSVETLAEDGSIQTLDTYQLSVNACLHATVTANGETLSAQQNNDSQQASFGSMSVVDGNQTFVMLQENCIIDIRGVLGGKGRFTLKTVRGLSMNETILAERDFWSHPSVHYRLELKDGEVTLIDLSYNPIDVTTTDENGNPVTGLVVLAGGYVKGQNNVYASCEKGADVIAKVANAGRVKIIAHDVPSGYSFVSVSNPHGQVCRGWMKTTAIRGMLGFVPDMAWLSGSYTVLRDTATYHGPDARAAAAYNIKAGAVVELRFVDRDANGQEWAYVRLPGKANKVNNTWLPASMLEGWHAMCAPTFCIGSGDPLIDTEISFPEVNGVYGQLVKVYSGPGKNTWRGAKGKASVDTGGGIYVAGWVNNEWMLVQYGTNIGNRRTGYVNAADLKDNYSTYPQLNFDAVPVTITAACILTDDPENYSEHIVSLEAGQQVTYLAEYAGYNGGQPFHYIETKVGGKVVRGFVPVGCLQK